MSYFYINLNKLIFVFKLMPKLETFKDILDIHVGEIKSDFSDNLKALFLYGSFSYGNLDRRTEDYESLNGKKGLLDSKPDFVLVVEDIQKGLHQVSKKDSWRLGNPEKLMRLGCESPFYFNFFTNGDYEVARPEDSERIKLPYKIGVVSLGDFLTDSENFGGSIYLPSRLSKHFNILSVDKSVAEKVSERISKIRDFYVDLALSITPSNFTGEEFTRKYLATTYLAEAYRVFDLFSIPFIRKPKYLSILEKQVYDVHSEEVVPMRHKLKEMLEPKLLALPSVERVSEGKDFFDSQFSNENPRGFLRNVAKFVKFNLSTLHNSYKNWVTNNAGGASSFGYVFRKFLR